MVDVLHVIQDGLSDMGRHGDGLCATGHSSDVASSRSLDRRDQVMYVGAECAS